MSFEFEAPLTDGGLSITHYNVYEDDGDLVFPTTPSLTITSLTHSKTVALPVSKGKVWSFKVSAVNFLGEGVISPVF